MTDLDEFVGQWPGGFRTQRPPEQTHYIPIPGFRIGFYRRRVFLTIEGPEYYKRVPVSNYNLRILSIGWFASDLVISVAPRGCRLLGKEKCLRGEPAVINAVE